MRRKSDTEIPKDHLEEISNAGVTELLRSPEEALEKRLHIGDEIHINQKVHF